MESFIKEAARYIWCAISGVPRLINRIANTVVEQALKGVIEVADVRRAASRVNACRGGWKVVKGAYHLSPRLAILTLVSASSVGIFLYFLYNLKLGPLFSNASERSNKRPGSLRRLSFS